MEDKLKLLEMSIIRELAAAYSRTSVKQLASQRDADVKRLMRHSPVTEIHESIQDRLRGMLVLSIELKGDNCQEGAWRSGVEGAILEGRMSILREILDWMVNRAA